MTALRFLGVGHRETFTEHMDRLARDGVPNIDSGADGTVDGPDRCYDACGLPFEHTEDACAAKVGELR